MLALDFITDAIYILCTDKHSDILGFMKKRNMKYVNLYIFSYVALGVLLPLLGQYLKGIGYSGTRIGCITAGGTTVAILASAFWGSKFNQSMNKKKMLLRMCAAASLVCVVLFFVKNYFIFLIFFCLLYFFQSPIMAFIDAMAIEDAQPFGAARKWGAVGFASGVFFAGKLSQLLGLPVIFFLYSASFLICALILLVMSKKHYNISAASIPRQKIKSEVVLLANRKYIKILVCAFFMCGSVVANNVYFGFLYTQGGGSVAGIGLAFLLMAGSEAPFMGWSARLADRFSLEKTLLAAMCISVVRFAWYATCPSSALLLVFFFLQGMVNGIMLVELIRYVSKVVNPGQLGMAISVYYALGSSLSTILCQLLGGVLLDFWGTGSVYIFFACMNAVGVIIYIVGKLYRNGA